MNFNVSILPRTRTTYLRAGTFALARARSLGALWIRIHVEQVSIQSDVYVVRRRTAHACGYVTA